MVEWIMCWSSVASFSHFMTEDRLSPVLSKPKSFSPIRTQAGLRGDGKVEKIPTTTTSCAWAARTVAGRSFAPLRLVKGKRTRTTSPGRNSATAVKVFLSVPLGESRFGQFHHLEGFTAGVEIGENSPQLFRRQLRQQFLYPFYRNIYRHFRHRTHSFRFTTKVYHGMKRQATNGASRGCKTGIANPKIFSSPPTGERGKDYSYGLAPASSSRTPDFLPEVNK